MSRIRGTNTKPELLLRKALWKKGLRYRLHDRIEGARPDIVFRTQKLAIFIDGCFWHGCPEHYVRPRSKSEFWAHKLESNAMRDRAQTLRLIESGWTVQRFWEHEVEKELERVIAVVLSAYEEPGKFFPSRRIVVRVEAQTGNTELWLIEDLLDPNVLQHEYRPRAPLKA
jgi:DNA mismatch endonuclease (patch repair protein)